MTPPVLRRAGADPARATAGIVMIHGRGGSSADILGLLDAAALPDVAAVAPDAPGASWWPTSFLAPTAPIAPFVTAGLTAVAQGVAALTAGGLPRGRIWLLGFSQGACLALEAFARDGAGLAGVFAFSGGLVGTADADGPPDSALYGHGPKRFGYADRRDGARAWISCHERDQYIPIARVEETARALKGMGVDVETMIYPGAGHSVMRADIAALRARLNG